MKKILFILLLLSLACAWGDTLSGLFSLNILTTFKHVSGNNITTEEGKTRISLGFDNGTATNSAQANAVYTIRSQVTSAAAVVYDLQNLTDGFGGTIVFNRVKWFAFRNIDSSDSITIGSGSAPWAFDMATQSVITVGPTGAHVTLCPYAGLNASATNRNIYVNTTGDLASFDLSIGGTE